MSPMRLIILVIAAVAAIIAAILVRNLAAQPAALPDNVIQPMEVVKEVEVSQTKVLVAREDLRVGTLLNSDHFIWADWPEGSVNPSFITETNNPDAMEEVTGSVVRSAMYIDEPIMPVKIVAKGETGFMAALLKPGMRAATVEVSPETASAGFILPDDRVDVILTYEVEAIGPDGEATEQTVTKTIMENARILAIDQSFGSVDGAQTLNGSMATMELTPQQAELMALAQRMGRISLTLRSVADADWNDGNSVASTELLDGAGGSGNGVSVYRNGTLGAGGSL